MNEVPYSFTPVNGGETAAKLVAKLGAGVCLGTPQNADHLGLGRVRRTSEVQGNKEPTEQATKTVKWGGRKKKKGEQRAMD